MLSRDIGALAPGMSADLIAFRSDSWPCVGAAVHDRWPRRWSSAPKVDLSLINGRWVVRTACARLDRVVHHHNHLARQLAEAL